ncbi:hypothetical protein ABZ027_08290 [Streptomyces sp. NPDC006332]|uniref:hypothetical protein n=1 Tax=Streptomyces sp. NPDC006332 TaxID=3155456 RepID=UPI00339EDB14
MLHELPVYVSRMRQIAILGTVVALATVPPLALGLGVSERAGLASLAMVSAVATIGGVLWGARELRAEYRKLKWRTRGLHLVTQSELAADEQERLRRLILPPSSTGLDVLYVRELVRLHILEHAAENLGTPLALTLLGVVGGTGASVWSLWA